MKISEYSIEMIKSKVTTMQQWLDGGHCDCGVCKKGFKEKEDELKALEQDLATIKKLNRGDNGK